MITKVESYSFFFLSHAGAFGRRVWHMTYFATLISYSLATETNISFTVTDKKQSEKTVGMPVAPQNAESAWKLSKLWLMLLLLQVSKAYRPANHSV